MGFYDNMHTQQLEKLRAQERLALSEAQRDAAATTTPRRSGHTASSWR